MIKKLDTARLNFVLPIGRRFYTACMMLLKYMDLLCVTSGFAYVNGYDPEENNRSIEFCFASYSDVFDPYGGIQDPDRRNDDTELIQLFKLLRGEMFLNVYRKLNYYQFTKYYQDRYVRLVSDSYYVISKTIVPIEINVCNILVKCNSGEDEFLTDTRYPLIDALCESDEVVEFIDRLTSALMFSTHLYTDLQMRFAQDKIGSFIDFSIVHKLLEDTWDVSVLDIAKCFKYRNN